MHATALLHVLLLATVQPLDAHKHAAQRILLDSPFSTKFAKVPNLRSKRSSEHIISKCVTVESNEGHYFYKAANENNEVCGLFFFTEPDRTVEVYFNYLDVSCDDGGLVSFVDGWELNGQYFPGISDHPKPLENRFTEFCGTRKPKQVFKSSQNAALIQYKVPKKANGFSITVRFPKNRMPCNVLLQDTQGIYTLRNYGKKVNCSITALFPAVTTPLSVSVGVAGNRAGVELETGIIHKCQKRGLDDYVQIGGSFGLDNSDLFVVESICGINSKPGPEQILFCETTTVRLVSSGAYDNSVTMSLRKAVEDDISPAATLCPFPDEV